MAPRSWSPSFRGYCEAFTYIEPLPDFSIFRQPDNYIWQNTTSHVVPGGGVVVIFDPITLLPIRIGVTDNGFAICPGDLGRLNLRGVVEVLLPSTWTTDILQTEKIYLAKQANGSWRATNVQPAIGFFFGRAMVNPDKYWNAGEAAKSGSKVVRVQFDFNEAMQLFGIVNQDTGELDNDLNFPNTSSSIPVNVVAPVISGLTTVGSVLSTTNGTWTEVPSSWTYQWYNAGVAIAGRTLASYTIVAGDVGDSLTCKVVAINPVGSSAPATSNAIVGT